MRKLIDIILVVVLVIAGIILVHIILSKAQPRMFILEPNGIEREVEVDPGCSEPGRIVLRRLGDATIRPVPMPSKP